MARQTSRSRNPLVDTTVAVRFWPHGDLWNGAAIDLPILVRGVTLDEARVNMGNALVRLPTDPADGCRPPGDSSGLM